MIAYISDLTHVSDVVATSRIFPLAPAYLASYAKKIVPNLAVEIFKYANDLNQAVIREMPDFLCMSNYSWNLNLSYVFAQRAKEINPQLIVIFGGPNFPTSSVERAKFMREYSSIDFYIYGEGEEGFVSLLSKLIDAGLDISQATAESEPLDNCCYLHDNRLVTGAEKRIRDVNIIPNPYTTGILDKFFDQPLIPIFETTRGCPFSCTFCYSGHKSLTRIGRFAPETTIETLEYIAKRGSNIDELICADLNFGMFKEDLQICAAIAKIQKTYGYPKRFSAYAGKNKPERVIKAVELLGGSWTMGSAMQSTDPDVLEAIKRKNISPEKLLGFVDYAKENDSTAYFELILGLPLDSKEKHYESMRLGVDTGLNNSKSYQLTLLLGTEIANLESRLKYEYVTRWRVMPRCFGIYQMLGKTISVAETEEIVIGNNTMSTEDYLDCRLLDFFVDVFINSNWFQEPMSLIQKLGFSIFDFLLFLKASPELYTEKLSDIFLQFKQLTMSDLFDSKDDINRFISDANIIELHINGKRGINELNECKALCYKNMDAVFETVYRGAIAFLEEKEACTEEISDYLEELKVFTLMRKLPFDQEKRLIQHNFKYDFKRIYENKFLLDSSNLEPHESFTITMWHDKDQEKQFTNLIRLYGDSLAGLGKILQTQDMNKFNRKFDQSTCTVN